MVGPYALNNDEADELLEWFKKRHRVKASEPARREHEALLRAMREQQQPEPPPPRDDLPVHYFVYDPHHQDEPQIIGYRPGTIDRHGNDLVPAELVPPDHPLATHTFTAGVLIEATEADPQLISFLRSNRLFRAALHRIQENSDGPARIPARRSTMTPKYFSDAMRPQASVQRSSRAPPQQPIASANASTCHRRQRERNLQIRVRGLTMRDVPLRKPREEKFCQLVAQGVKPTQAYRDAGFAPAAATPPA